MAASCLEFDPTTKKGSYAISKESELNKLPTTTEYGKDELAIFQPCVSGSDCICIANSKVYLLDGDTDTWKNI